MTQVGRIHLSGIQAVRGVAALAVTLFHVGVTLGRPEYGGRIAFGGWYSWGDIGVDVFFVLSGFIIFHAHEEDIGQPHRWQSYLYRRLVRIYPIYWIYTSLLVASALCFGALVRQFSLQDYLTSYFLVRFSDVAPPLGVAWTLFHEIVFYLLFGILLIGRRWGAVVLICWLAVILAAFDPRGGTFLGVITSAFNLYFFIGMASVRIWKKGWFPPKLELALSGILFLVFICFDHFGMRAQSPLLRILVAPASFFLLISLAALDARSAIRYPGWLLLLGDASYSIYLLHYVVCSVLAKLLAASGCMDWLPTNVLASVLFVVAVGVGIVGYLLVERPLMRLLHPSRTRSAASIPS